MNLDELIRCYRSKPPRAAEKVREHLLRALQALDAGDFDRAIQHWDHVDAYQAVLDELVCCRRCGRPLTHPASVARKIGPECAAKTGIGGCPFCGGAGQMAFPDPVLGGYTDHDCWCVNRPRAENVNGTSGEATATVPPVAGDSI